MRMNRHKTRALLRMQGHYRFEERKKEYEQSDRKRL